MPKPFELWRPAFQKLIFPLNLVFAIGWSLEMITHLEELCFWLFLVNAGHAQQDWFHSAYFKTWCAGSLLALAYMPTVVSLTKSDPLKMEAYTFLAGSLGSLSLTLWFTPILWTFPSFLANLKAEGVDTQTLVRLTTFHELNTIRVAFRFLFTVPFLILGVDGVRPHVHINSSFFWTDTLTMISAVGCCVSSGITLIIFFPRNVETELSAKEAAKASRSRGGTGTVRSSTYGGPRIASPAPPEHVQLRSMSYDADAKSAAGSGAWEPPQYAHFGADPEHGLRAAHTPVPSSAGLLYKPNRRLTDEEGGGVALGGVGSLTEAALDSHNRRQSKHHLLHNYTSPLDLAYQTGNR
jgi:hypothetical protein